jgi:two-component system sensor histidine kinase RegB
MSPVSVNLALGLDALPAASQQRLIVTRAALILAEAVGIGLVAGVLDARLPLLSLGLIVFLHAALNAAAWRRARAGGTGTLEVSLQLAVDAASIAALVYLTGGYANPFISLLLVPLILAAVTLPPLHAWAMAAWVGVLYTLLMHYYTPLAIQVSPAMAVDLHLTGMWLNFLLTAALVAAFAGRLAASLRRRDAELARVREQRLRDDHLFALGLQAASAAHDLATPLASVRITLDELRRDYAGDDELDQPLALLSGQVVRLEKVLERLAAVARGRDRQDAPRVALDGWLRRVLEHWGLLWPDARVDLEVSPDARAIPDDAALEAALVTLLNNAARFSPGEIRVTAAEEGEVVAIQVSDRGPGLGAGAENSPGWGVGLDIVRAAMDRLGGRLDLANRPGGGVVARLEFPASPGTERA